MFLALLVIPSACFVVLIVRFVVNRRRHLSLFRDFGIPGPEPHFLSGNTDDLFSAPAPHEVISAWLKKYGDVFGYFAGEVPHIVVKDLDMLKQILIKDFEVFCDRPFGIDVEPYNKSLLGLKGRRWKEVRTILTPTFSSGKIKLMTEIVNKKVDITLDIVTGKAENNEMFDMYELVQGLTLDVIAACALAMTTHCQENPEDAFFNSVRDSFKHVNNRAIKFAMMFPFVADLMVFFNKFMTAGQMTSLVMDKVNTAISERCKNPKIKSMDLLQLMLDNRENEERNGKGMTDDEILANAFTFLIVGFDTTANALAFVFYLLIKHPDVQERLYEEIAEVEDANYSSIQNLQYLDQVFSESLRIYPPVTLFISRFCNQDHKVGSIIIPEGTTVMVPVWDIHHDPELWPEPWKFDPDRFSLENRTSLNSMAYMPFGAGRRNCIGARFALLEAKLAVFRLLKQFKFEACEKTEDPLTLVCPTVVINPANGVYLKATPRTGTI
ncbi:Cytochrome P450 3A24 like protein [Argiope bruennichi]|uniref:Cytochrome P450 3A24 like protein n=1 Tax=Argiope bruennichi TaxID=94029 RepID=A0A8T0ET19_ARGBR|nr:Cytochrome P450 3A24 like protein [Argiope bruennichi]